MQAKLKRIPKFLKKHLKLIIPIVLVIIIVVVVVNRAGQSSTSYITEEVQVRNVATYLTFTGNIEAVNDATLISKVAQTVTSVNVSIGDEVKKGDVIATLDDSSIQRSIAKQEANLSSTELSNYYTVKDAQKTYTQYLSGIQNGQNSQLMSSESNVNSAKVAYESAKDDYDRKKMELESNIDSSMISANNQIASAKMALDNAQTNYDNNEADIRGLEKGVENAQDAYDANPSASNLTSLNNATSNLESAEDKRTSLQASIDSAQMSYDNAYTSYLSSYYTAEVNLDSYYDAMNNKYTAYVEAQASYNSTLVTVNQTLENYADNLEKVTATTNSTSAQLELDSLYDELDDYKILATIDGTITSLPINEGDSVTATTTVAEITDYSKMKVAIQIDETDITNIDNGLEMTISVDALNSSYTGTVQNISRKATVSSGLSYFTADVVFEADDNIRSGLSAEVSHLLNGVENVVSVSMSALNYNDDNTAYVLVGKSSNSAENREVSVGITNGTYVEITSGLSEGETVLVEQDTTSALAMTNMQMGGGNMGAAPSGGGGAPSGGGGGNAGGGGGAPGGN